MDDYPEKPKRDFADPRETPCHVCGENEYTWGNVSSQGGVYFLPDYVPFGWGMGKPVEARQCLTCGNIQIFMKRG